jgi:hypothetical protein
VLDRLVAVVAVRRGRLLLLLRLGGSPPAQAPEHAAARLGARQARGHVAGRRLPDPAFVLRPQRAQVAHLVAVPARRQVRLGALPLEDRAPAHVARDDVVDRP